MFLLIKSNVGRLYPFPLLSSLTERELKWLENAEDLTSNQERRVQTILNEAHFMVSGLPFQSSTRDYSYSCIFYKNLFCFGGMLGIDIDVFIIEILIHIDSKELFRRLGSHGNRSQMRGFVRLWLMSFKKYRFSMSQSAFNV